MSGVKLEPGSGSVGLVSAPSHRHTPQHSEILTEAFKSRTFSRKTFCNTSSVLSRQECLLEELSLEGSSLQSGTPPPCCGASAPRGLCGGCPPAHSFCATATGSCRAGSFCSKQHPPPSLQGSMLGFFMGLFWGEAIFTCN